MNNLNSQALRYFQGLLVTICGILFLFTVYELIRPYQLFPAAPSIERDEQTVVETQASVIRPALPQEAFSEIVERPLFMENRRPYVPPVSKGPKEPKRPHQVETDILTLISLSAIVITKDKRIALIEDNRTRKLQQLRRGETFNGWTLTDIRTNSIAMQKGQDTRQIELVVKPSRTASEKPQDVKPKDTDKKLKMASPANVSEDVNKTK